MIKVSETLYEAIKNFLNFSPEVANHMENSENPHVVTKEQVGLGNVSNEKQTTKAEYTAHIEGTADKHTANDVMYSQSQTVKERMDDMAVEGGAGTMYHDELLNRDLENAHPMTAIAGLGAAISGIEDDIEEIENKTITLVFEGVTTDAADTYLTCSDTESEYINDSGYAIMPPRTIANIDVNVIGVPLNVNGGVGVTAGGTWSTRGMAFRVGTSATTFCKVNEISVIRMNDEETSTTVRLAPHSGAYIIIVKGLADTEMHWRAEIKISNVLKVDE